MVEQHDGDFFAIRRSRKRKTKIEKPERPNNRNASLCFSPVFFLFKLRLLVNLPQNMVTACRTDQSEYYLLRCVRVSCLIICYYYCFYFIFSSTLSSSNHRKCCCMSTRNEHEHNELDMYMYMPTKKIKLVLWFYRMGIIWISSLWIFILYVSVHFRYCYSRDVFRLNTASSSSHSSVRKTVFFSLCSSHHLIKFSLCVAWIEIHSIYNQKHRNLLKNLFIRFIHTTNLFQSEYASVIKNGTTHSTAPNVYRRNIAGFCVFSRTVCTYLHP